MVVIVAFAGVALIFLGLALTSIAINLIGRRDESHFSNFDDATLF
jgi:hypothetical protein